MHYNKVEICGVNTSKLPCLSDSEKKNLLDRSKAGDTLARERLIDGNLRLVLSIIQRFAGKKESADDLFQVGCIGLIKAIDNFNTELDVKFSTYAVPMIIGEVRRYLRDNNSLHVSRSVRDLACRALQAKEQLSLSDGKEPSFELIAQVIGSDVRSIETALEAISEPISLFDPVYNEGGDTVYIMDQLRDENTSDEAWLEDIALREAMKTLSEREKTIINMRYYGGKTQMEIASVIGISQAQVSRLEKGAFERIRRQM